MTRLARIRGWCRSRTVSRVVWSMMISLLRSAPKGRESRAGGPRLSRDQCAARRLAPCEPLRLHVGALANRIEQAPVLDLVEVCGRVAFRHRLRVDKAAADRARARIDRLHPAADVLVLVQAQELVGAIIGAVVEVAEPGVGGDVGDRVVVPGKVFAAGQLPV